MYNSDRLIGLSIAEGHFFVPAIEILRALNLKDEKDILRQLGGPFFIFHKVTMKLACQHRCEFIVQQNWSLYRRLFHGDAFSLLRHPG
jgi:hypothetical protein